MDVRKQTLVHTNVGRGDKRAKDVIAGLTRNPLPVLTHAALEGVAHKVHAGNDDVKLHCQTPGSSPG